MCVCVFMPFEVYWVSTVRAGQRRGVAGVRIHVVCVQHAGVLQHKWLLLILQLQTHRTTKQTHLRWTALSENQIKQTSAGKLSYIHSGAVSSCLFKAGTSCCFCLRSNGGWEGVCLYVPIMEHLGDEQMCLPTSIYLPMSNY